MRAVLFAGKDTVEVVERPMPEIGPDEVLLKVGAAGICHSDIVLLGAGERSPAFGEILGHEIAGTVEQLGSQVEGVSIGERVLVSVLLTCGQCSECLAGRDNQCEAAYNRGDLVPATPGIGTPGGMAEYFKIKARLIEPIGDLDFAEAAPLADAAVTPLHAINTVRSRLTGGSTVVLIGLGGLGHMALQILLATSGARVIVIDTDAEKLEYAREHGASLAIVGDGETAARVLEETGGRGAHVVLDFVGAQATVDLAVACVRPGGAIRFVGLGGGSFTYRADAATRLPWGVNIERAYGGTRSEIREAVALAREGKITAEVTRYPLDEAVRAFDDLHHGRVRGRAVLLP